MSVFSPSAAALTNPYKFKVYRTAALTSTSGAETVLTYDTRSFDTGSNVDITTNKGRFTIPLSGFYQLNANYSLLTTVTLGYIVIKKNGTTMVVRGNDIRSSMNGATVGVLDQFTAGDYVEVFYYVNAAISFDVTNAGTCSFSGFLVSAT